MRFRNLDGSDIVMIVFFGGMALTLVILAIGSVLEALSGGSANLANCTMLGVNVDPTGSGELVAFYDCDGETVARLVAPTGP